MAAPHTVLHSFNLDGEMICVDIFRRKDGSYGFDQFRRDVEDVRGWYSISHRGHLRFDSETEALDAARAEVGWLRA